MALLTSLLRAGTLTITLVIGLHLTYRTKLQLTYHQHALRTQSQPRSNGNLNPHTNPSGRADIATLFTHPPGTPYMYLEQVDFRIIVLTFNRTESLVRLLQSLNTVEIDGDTARLEIWIDRDMEGQVSNETVRAALDFRWTGGPSRVHVQNQHVGIYGQWIDSWRPRDSSKKSKELVLFVEDDISVSPYIYRWTKNVHQYFRKRRGDFMGAALTNEQRLCYRRFVNNATFTVPHTHTVSLQKCIGTWGFSPNPHRWFVFQKWYHAAKLVRNFRPYVPGIVATDWYKTFERSNKTKSMWSMWLLYYVNQERLFTVFDNLNKYNNNTKSCLAINRREIGLHYPAKEPPGLTEDCLLRKWKNEFVRFPSDALTLDWFGNRIDYF